MGQDKRREPCAKLSPRISHWLTCTTVLRKKENGLRTVQPTKPTAERRRIGYPMGSWTTEHLAVGQEAVVWELNASR
jgi:hypothetical protein